jgi:hypothetical protein
MNSTLDSAVPIEAGDFWPLRPRYVNIGGATKVPEESARQLVGG